MLNESQLKYLSILPDDKSVQIGAHDIEAQKVGEKVREEIRKAVPDLEVYFTGATSLGLAGMNDVDISIVSRPEDFDKYLPEIISILGEPLKRSAQNIRWEIVRGGYPVDVHMTDGNSRGWCDHKKIYELLRDNSDIAKEYEKMKLSCDGLSVKEYQKRKYEFYNRYL